MDHDFTPSVSQICDKLGRRRIAQEIGVRLTSVSNAVTDGRFPARWFDVIERLCEASDLPCPRHLFSFVGVEDGSEGESHLIPNPAVTAASSEEQNHDQTSHA